MNVGYVKTVSCALCYSRHIRGVLVDFLVRFLNSVLQLFPFETKRLLYSTKNPPFSDNEIIAGPLQRSIGVCAVSIFINKRFLRWR